MSTQMRTRALVLGGGGPVGTGWQAGMITGLRDAGVDLSTADAILGTSAGAIVGAFLALGHDFPEAVLIALSALERTIEADALKASFATLRSAMERARLDPDPQGALKAVGGAARRASTMAEADYLALFAPIAGGEWPAAFRCTAIDTDTGELVVWGPDSGVPLQHAVASSSAVPMLFPPVEIAGRHYMDGGILSPLNTTAAPAAATAVVLSCLPLKASDPELANAPTAAVGPDTEIALLRRTMEVIALEPDFADLGATPNLMDPDLAIQSVQIGRRQARHASTLIQSVWNP
jgi:NTE family protein